MSKKIVKSRDVMFLEDQLDDGDKVEKASSSIEISIRIDPIVPPRESYRKVMVSLKIKMTLYLMMLSQLNKLMENFHYPHTNHHREDLLERVIFLQDILLMNM